MAPTFCGQAAVTLTLTFLKRLIVVFWALWWSLAFLTDLLGAAKELGMLALPWLPHSNYPGLVAALAPYQVPVWLPGFLFAGIICWSFLSSILLWLAVATPRRPLARWRMRVNRAFIVSLSLWLAFFIADQVVMRFDLEENHMVQGGFQLLCLLALYLLPDDDGAPSPSN